MVELQEKLNTRKLAIIEEAGGRWNSDTAADYFVAVVEAYHEVAGDAFDAADLRGIFRHDANLNNSYNRMRKAGHVTQQTERGAGKLNGLI